MAFPSPGQPYKLERDASVLEPDLRHRRFPGNFYNVERTGFTAAGSGAVSVDVPAIGDVRFGRGLPALRAPRIRRLRRRDRRGHPRDRRDQGRPRRRVQHQERPLRHPRRRGDLLRGLPLLRRRRPRLQPGRVRLRPAADHPRLRRRRVLARAPERLEAAGPRLPLVALQGEERPRRQGDRDSERDRGPLPDPPRGPGAQRAPDRHGRRSAGAPDRPRRPGARQPGQGRSGRARPEHGDPHEQDPADGRRGLAPHTRGLPRRAAAGLARGGERLERHRAAARPGSRPRQRPGRPPHAELPHPAARGTARAFPGAAPRRWRPDDRHRPRRRARAYALHAGARALPPADRRPVRARGPLGRAPDRGRLQAAVSPARPPGAPTAAATRRAVARQLAARARSDLLRGRGDHHRSGPAPAAGPRTAGDAASPALERRPGLGARSRAAASGPDREQALPRNRPAPARFRRLPRAPRLHR